MTWSRQLRKHAVFCIIFLHESILTDVKPSCYHSQFRYAPHLAKQMFSLNRLQVIWTSQPFCNESVVTELHMHKCSLSPSRTYSLVVSFSIHSLEEICPCGFLKHLDSLYLDIWKYIFIIYELYTACILTMYCYVRRKKKRPQDIHKGIK